MTRIWSVSQMLRTDRSRLRGSTGRPVLVVNTSRVSGHADPIALWYPSLPFGLASERFTGQVEERQGTLAGMSLNRCEKDLAAKRAAAGGGSGRRTGRRGSRTCSRTSGLHVLKIGASL
jgi:hypothetical protein